MPNCIPKHIYDGDALYICLFAHKDILPGTELRYNYGISGEEWQKVLNIYIFFRVYYYQESKKN